MPPRRRERGERRAGEREPQRLAHGRADVVDRGSAAPAAAARRRPSGTSTTAIRVPARSGTRGTGQVRRAAAAVTPSATKMPPVT